MDTGADITYLESTLAQVSLSDKNPEQKPPPNASKAKKAKYALTRLKEILHKSEDFEEAEKNELLQKLLEHDGKVLRGQRGRNDEDFDWYGLEVEIIEIEMTILGNTKE